LAVNIFLAASNQWKS